jgi:hypothetical protein
MAQTQSFTGRFGRAQVLGVEIGITRWTAKARKEFADATDSNDFDTGTGQLWTSQLPGVVGFDGTLEGYYDAAGTTDANFIQKFKSDGPYATSLYLSRTVLFMTANVDYSDVEISVSIPGATMVSFTANWKSNGVPTSIP